MYPLRIAFFSFLLFDIVTSASVPLNRQGWTATADSFQTGNEAAKAIDGDATTFWHSKYDPNDPLPNSITIDMKTSSLVTGVSIQPRQDGSANGRIGEHKIELSTDGSQWGQAVAVGTYVNDGTTKKTTFVGRNARYVRVTALSEAQGANNPWTSAAEVNVFTEKRYSSRSAWTVTADSAEPNNAASAAVDGEGGSIWHSKYSAPAAPLPHWFRIDQGSQVEVAGLSYLPRADGGNGRIGRYNVESSNDGQQWAKVSEGTWADNGEEKFAIFSATARYFRLNALTEAGGRGPWSSAAEVNLIDPAPVAYVAPDPTKGIWLNTIDIPLVPAAAANMPNGKVLLWSAYKLDDFGSGTGLTQTAIYDPATGTATQRTVTDNRHDMFCPGISMDFNGRIIVTGGNNAEKTTIYDPAADGWVAGANMRVPRGYQSTTTTSDGRVFNIGGSWSGGEGGKNGEIYNPSSNQWSLIQNALVSPMLTNDRGGVYRADNHAWLFGWKQGSVFQAGPSKAMNWYNTTGAGSVKGAGLRADDPDAMNGNAVMYDAVAGKILTMGGAQHYQGAQTTKNAYNMTIGNPGTNPQVAKTASMAYARGFANAVVLPDGSTIVAGGQSWVEPFTDTTAAFAPELWNPATGRWTELNPMAIPRTYHSVALLLPDATVFVGGGGLCGGCGTNHWDAETFVPPYLLNADGSRKPRPVISNVAATAKLGASLTITTGGTVRSFSLVRLGTATHTVNTDQRRVPLTPTGSGTSYRVTIPSDPGVALPGYWFLFALDASGTPSVAKTIKITT